MPANLTPQYLKAEEEYKAAQTRQEKIAALESMIALLPKHKGTDKLFADLKRRLAKLKESPDNRHGTRLGGPKVPREGAAQVVLLGFPNVGKSRLLKQLTHAEPVVADYPFTTRTPMPGMMAHLDIRIQLVDMPAVTPDFFDPWVPDVVRGADAALLVVDAGDEAILDQFQGVVDRLAAVRIQLTGTPGRRVVDPVNGTRLPALLVANKMDLPGAAGRVQILAEMASQRLPRVEVSAATGQGLEALRQRVWEHLGLIRIYTKPPGKPPDMTSPYTVPAGSTVQDLCAVVHRDFAENLKFARIWGHGVHAGQRVSRDHVLHDGDLLELHL